MPASLAHLQKRSCFAFPRFSGTEPDSFLKVTLHSTQGFFSNSLVLALFEADSLHSESGCSPNLTRGNSKISWRKNGLVLVSLLFIWVQFEIALTSISKSSKKPDNAHVDGLCISNTSAFRKQVCQVLPLHTSYISLHVSCEKT